MRFVALRLLALVALILMPFGMGTGMARAAEPSAHVMTQGSAEGHCGDQDKKSGSKVLGMHCAASCSGLTQSMGATMEADDLVATPFAATLVQRLAGLMPLPSIPPPRMS